jgi:two-component system sensor histidine kinase YesM
VVRLQLSIYHKLVLVLIALVLVPLLGTTIFGLVQSRGALLEQVAESREYALILTAERVEGLADRMVSAAFFALRSDQLADWMEELDLQNGRTGLSPTERIVRQGIFSGIDAFLQNMSINLIGAQSYIGLVTADSSVITSYPRGDSSERHLRAVGRSLHADDSHRVAWRGLEPNYIVSAAPESPTVLTFAIRLADPGSSGPDPVLVISLPEQALGAAGRIPGAPGLVTLADSERRTSVTFQDGQRGLGSQLSSRVLEEGSSQGSVAVDGRRYYFASQPILGGRLSLFHAFDEATVTAELQRIGTRQLAVAGLISLLALAAAFLFARHIALPLQKLTRYARSFRLGALPIAEEARTDEVGLLQRAFLELHLRVEELLDERTASEDLKRKAELEALQAQIQPHFLFNTLNTIRWAAVNGNTTKVSSTIVALASLLKMTITSEDALVPLSYEFEVLRKYADIMQLRQETSLDFTFAVAPDVAEIRLPRLILQPLLENAILHAFAPGEQGMITARASRRGADARIEIIDNGRGIDLERAAKPSGFTRVGIPNVRERLRLHYGSRADLSITARSAGGTEAVVTIEDECSSV